MEPATLINELIDTTLILIIIGCIGFFAWATWQLCIAPWADDDDM